jgi:hypothetical protein
MKVSILAMSKENLRMRAETKPAVAEAPRSPSEVAKGLDQAFQDFRRAYPDISKEEALEMWKAAGG